MAAQRMCDGETRQRSSEIGIPWGGMTERISGRQASHFHTDHRDDKDAAPGKSPSIDSASMGNARISAEWRASQPSIHVIAS